MAKHTIARFAKTSSGRELDMALSLESFTCPHCGKRYLVDHTDEVFFKSRALLFPPDLKGPAKIKCYWCKEIYPAPIYIRAVG
jgi:hypothetical protein